MKVNLLSRAQLLATPWTTAYQAPLSMGFSRQEYWSGVPSPSLKAIAPVIHLVLLDTNLLLPPNLPSHSGASLVAQSVKNPLEIQKTACNARETWV